jgi:hypothetical protein
MSMPPPLSDSSGAASLESGAAPTACARCGAPELSQLAKLPVCDACLAFLVKHPFPVWVKLGALLVLALVMVSLGMSGERFKQALHFARAQKMTRAGHWEEAYQAYQGVIGKQTSDTEVMISYAEVAVRSGHPEDSARTLEKLVGRQVTNVQMSRAKAVGVELERLAKLQSQLNNLSLPTLELR